MAPQSTLRKDRYTMADTEFDLKYHIAFCPKYGRPVLETLADELKSLFLQKAEELDIEILEMHIRPNAVHLYITGKPTYEPQFIVSQLKSFTSKTLREEHDWLRSRLPTLWTRNYYIATDGSYDEMKMEVYLLGQKGK